METVTGVTDGGDGDHEGGAQAPAGIATVTSSYRVDGLTLACLEAGRGGEPLLMVHGFTGCKEDFADEMEPLADAGYHVVAPDLRGHGRSDGPDDESAYGLAAYAREMFGLADALGWRRFDLLGHSMGGMIAQLMALEAPERVRRLILMDTHHGVVPTLDRDLIDIGIQLARTEGLKAIQDILKMGADPLANPAYDRVCAERPGYQDFAEAKMLRCSPAMFAALINELSTVPDRLASLGAIVAPTLVQVGELDAPFIEASHRMSNVIPNAVLVVHPAAGHSPQFEATEHWRESLHGFLGSAAEVAATP